MPGTHEVRSVVIPPSRHTQQSGKCPRELKEITRRVVEALHEAGFLVSPKSVLESMTRIFSLGKHIDTHE